MLLHRQDDLSAAAAAEQHHQAEDDTADAVQNGSGQVNGGVNLADLESQAPVRSNGRMAKLVSMSTIDDDDVNGMDGEWKPVLPFQNVSVIPL